MTRFHDAPPLPQWLEELFPFPRRLVDVEDGLRIHVTITGEGPPVLLLHGNPTWAFLYRRVIAELAGEPFTLVAPDLVGLGYSDRPPTPSGHTLENHAGWIGRLVEGLGLEEIVLVVQDWGGPIGLLALEDRPDRLAGLVVLNTVLGPPKPGFRPTLFHRFSRIPVVSTVAFRVFGFPQRFLHLAQGDRASISGRVARAYAEPLRGWGRNAAPLALARMVPDSLDHPSIPPLERCREVVRRFRGPSAIVWGDRDPILGRLRRRTERLLPDAPVAATEAGHFLQEEVPGEIAAAVRSVAGKASGGRA